MKLQTKHREISPIQHELTIQFDWEEVEMRIPETIKKFRENSTFDGFRKDKAPKKVVVAQIGMKTIHERAANTAAWDAFNDAIKQMETSETRDNFKKPITPPEIVLDDIIEDEPVKFTAKYYIQPPEADKLAQELKNKNMPFIINPEDIFPQGPPNIHSHGPSGVSIEAIKSIPGVNLADSFIPRVIPNITDPQSMIPKISNPNQQLPDPEQLITPPQVKPTIPQVLEDIQKKMEEDKVDKEEASEKQSETESEDQPDSEKSLQTRKIT